MSGINIDRLMEYLVGSFEKNYQAEQKERLLKKILFNGKEVTQAKYDHSVALYKVAKTRCAMGDTTNARTFLYHCAIVMEVLDIRRSEL